MTDLVEAHLEVVDDVPLNLPLNFRRDPDAPQHSESRLVDGPYTAVRRVKYIHKTTCDGCGRPRQAQLFAVLRHDDTLEDLRVGMNCLRNNFREQALEIASAAGQYSARRRRAIAQLRLNVPTMEAAIEQVVETVKAGVPYHDHLVRRLREIDPLTFTPEDVKVLADYKRLAQYHLDWERNGHASLRWQALRTHPMLHFLKPREAQQVRELCDEALRLRGRLNETDIGRLNAWLARSARWQPPFPQLVPPEAYPSQETYEAALRTALQEKVREAAFTQIYWRTPFVPDPAQIVSTVLGIGYAVVGIEPHRKQRYRTQIMNEDGYRRGTRSVIVEEGTRGTYTVAAIMRRRGGAQVRDDEDSNDDVLEPERHFPYLGLGWALVEHYTPTHRLWHGPHARALLEDYA